MSNQNETKLIDGLIIKEKHQNAPDFVICKGSIKVDEFKKFIDENQNNGWFNFDILRSQQGKLYAKHDDWKPEQTPNF